MTSAAQFFKAIYRIRRTEEEIIRLYPTDKIKSPVHLSIGQEFVSVGVCEALRPDDIVFATYRSHAAYLAKGGDINGMWAELYGKRDGCARGKAGSMHLVNIPVGMMGASAIVGTTVPQSIGYAWALKQQGGGRIVVSFFGEGALDEGAMHESFNFAALKKLPILFVCENNQYAIYSHITERMPEANICERLSAYRIPARRIETGATQDLFAAVTDAVGRIRAGDGPQFLEVDTYRWRDHVGPGEDFYHPGRSDGTLEAWRAKDEVERLGAQLPAGERARIENEVETELAAAIAFAEASEYPEDSELYDHVFA
ncbi:MAG: thiamine pyrophosphate-dependent dehydrogenase E1 component subunit alpha [Alphaproteobacteria bacterium]